MTPARPAKAAAAPRAFLILDGERTVALTQAVVGLGRRFDNTVILDDARVSRAHAQLRLRYGRYVVYGLGSTGGTFVNGQRVEECVLRPGDVISLGGVPVIYGEDGASGDERRKDTHGTRPMTRPLPPPPERREGE
jgi:pSer/pThr/pTyr-binding forkhead associated (FHA) protein